MGARRSPNEFAGFPGAFFRRPGGFREAVCWAAEGIQFPSFESPFKLEGEPAESSAAGNRAFRGRSVVRSCSRGLVLNAQPAAYPGAPDRRCPDSKRAIPIMHAPSRLEPSEFDKSPVEWRTRTQAPEGIPEAIVVAGDHLKSIVGRRKVRVHSLPVWRAVFPFPMNPSSR